MEIIPRRWRQRVCRAIGLYVLVPYLSVVVIFVVFQRKLMYSPTVAENLQVAAVGLDSKLIRDVQIQTPDGSVLNGWLLKGSGRDSEDGHKPPLVVYFPGNSLNRHERIHDLREVAACGFDVLIFDYRGYGDSTGTPGEQNLTADARLVWEFACREVGGDEQRIVVFGESLGGAVALSLWSLEERQRPRPRALILSSTFASMSQTVAWHYPWFPFQHLLWDRWPSIDRMPDVRTDVIVFHGTADDFIPVAQGRELARASTGSRFFEIPGGGHNHIPMHRLRTELERIRASAASPAHREIGPAD